MNQQLAKEREGYYRSLFEISPASIIIEDAQGIIRDVNPAFSRIFGYSREEVIGRPIGILGVTDSNDKIQEHIRQVLSGRFLHHVVKNRRKNGQECYFDLNETMIRLPGEEDGVMVVANDITERVQANLVLQESEGRLSGILSSMVDLVFAFDQDRRFTFYHVPSALGLHLKPEKFMGRTHEEVMPASVEKPFRQAFEKCRRGGAVMYDYSLQTSSGVRWYSCQLSPLVLGGDFRGAVAVVSDITERRRIEEALNLHSLVYRSIEEAVIVFDRKGYCIDLNPAAEKMTGWEKQDFIGQKGDILNPPDQGKKITDQINSSLANKGIWQGELPLITKQGELRTMSTVVSCLKNNDGEWVGNIGINRDITEQKKIQEELICAHRLESLGVLAGGLAHDFNNLLMAIMGNASLARNLVQGESRELLVEIEQACQQAQGITRQLLTFARGGNPTKQAIDLQALIKEAVGLALRGTSIKCDDIKVGERCFVEGDPSQLSQVFNNLLINSVQAMPDGGEIEIALDEIDEGDTPGLLSPGPYVRVVIRDQGEGVKSASLGKIFDPFFSTKSEGTGLGLTVSYSIVKNHGGIITIDSVFGQGTSVTVYLPRSDQRPRISSSSSDLEPGQGRILVIDDDPSVALITTRLLAHLGYQVQSAPEGGKAIELYQTAQAKGMPFDVVIADLTVVGGMGGKETISRLRKIDSEIKAIVASGYSNDPVMSDYKSYGFCGMLSKPYEIASLSRELSRVMGREPETK